MNNKIIQFIKSKGITLTENPNAIASKMELWNEWYSGAVSDFHNYKIYQGKKKIRKNRKSLHMAETVCQDWADLLLNERVTISCSEEAIQDRLPQVLQQVNFYTKSNQLIERAFALGGGYLIQYWDGTQTNQKYITQDKMIPITYTASGLIEAAFASEITIGGLKLEYLELHTLDESGNYVIDNFYLQNDEKGEALTEMSADFYKRFNLAQKVITNSPVPKFQPIMPNKATKNKSAYGESIFAGAIDVLKAIDNEYDSLDNEFTLGRKRIFVNDGVSYFHVGEDGEMRPAFDPQDDVFYRLPDEAGEGANVVEVNMALRVEEHKAALQTQLNLLSQKVGLGENHYKWDSGQVSTATQVISENSKMFRAMKKHEILLGQSLINMAKSLMQIEAEYNNGPAVPEDATFTVYFDDSIIEDTEAEQRKALTLYTASLISKQEFYRKVYGFSDEEAANFAKKMQEEITEEMNWQAIEEEPQTE